jgi:hypothetical protein
LLLKVKPNKYRAENGKILYFPKLLVVWNSCRDIFWYLNQETLFTGPKLSLLFSQRLYHRDTRNKIYLPPLHIGRVLANSHTVALVDTTYRLLVGRGLIHFEACQVY